MPITKRNGKYYWGSKGPFDSRQKAAEVAQAAHASGYEGTVEKALPLAAIGGALGRVAMTGGRAMAANKLKEQIGQTAGTAIEIDDPSSEQDSHAQTEWENIHRSKAIQKLMNFVQKEDDTEEPSDEITEFAWKLRDEARKKAAQHRHPREWKDPHPDLLLSLSDPRIKLFLDTLGEREDGTTFNQPNINHAAYNYLDFIQRDVPMTARKHLEGLRKVEAAKQYQQHLLTGVNPAPGREDRYLDGAKLDFPDAGPWVRGRKQTPEWRAANKKEMNVHDFLKGQGTPLVSHLSGNEQAIKTTKQLFDSVSRESPSFKPTGAFETDPDIQRYFSVQKLMNFVQIQKLGYTTQPENEGLAFTYEPDAGSPDRFVTLRDSSNQRSTELTPQGQGGSESVQKIGRDIGGQSYGLPAVGSKGHARILDIVAPSDSEWKDHDPVSEAHYYLNHIKNQADPNDLRPERNATEVDMHMLGHRALATVHNIMNYGEDYLTHPDAIKYLKHEDNPDHSYEDRRAAENRGEEYDVPLYSYSPPMEGTYQTNNPSSALHERPYESIEGAEELAIPLEEYHRAMVNGHLDAQNMTNAGLGMADDLHRRIRMESPHYNPEDQTPYHQSQFPGSQRSGRPLKYRVDPEDPRRMESGLRYSEVVEEPPGQVGREASPEEQERRHSKDLPYDAPGQTFAYPTFEMRRQEHDTREPTEGPLTWDENVHGKWLEGIDLDTVDRVTRHIHHEKDKRLWDAFNAPQIAAEKRQQERRAARQKTETKDAFQRGFPGLYGDKEKSVNKLMKFMRKEGAVGGEGGGFDGLSDTVFTSTNAGIFTPTYGGKGTKKRHHKNSKRQDKKRHKLMGKEKKSGVERLVQYLYDGSPHIAKAGKMGLAPGLDEDRTGDAPTAHAGKNRVHSPMRINWEKDVSEDTLNHKRTSRPLEDALQVAENNEPHVNMGLAGGMETGTTSTYPRHDSVNSVGNGTTQRKAVWGKDNSYVQKAVNGVSTMISPTENQSADGPHPQQAYIERTKDNPNEAPAKDAVLKENDMQRRVKKYDDKEEDTGHEQPAGAMAAAGMGGYPSGATMQMSSFGMNTYEQDSLARGGEEDTGHDEEDIDEEKEGDNPRIDEEGNMWIPMNPDRTKSLESMRKALEDAGDATPLLTALHKFDYS